MSNDRNRDPAADAFERHCKHRWEQNCQARGLSNGAIKRYLTAIDTMLMQTNKRLWELDNESLACWCMHLVCDRKLATTTVHAYQLAVCRFSEYLGHQNDLQLQARDDFGASFRVLSSVALPTRERSPERRPEALSRKQIDQLFQYLADRIRWAQSEAPHEVGCLRRDRAMYFVVYAYSLHVAECVSLNIDSWREVTSLPYLGQWGELILPGSGGGRSRRSERHVVSTLSSISPLMDWYMREVHPAFRVLRDALGRPLFTRATGRRISTHDVHARFKEHLRGAGMDTEQHTLGSLRRAAIEHECQRSSVDFVLNRLGHKRDRNLMMRLCNTYLPQKLIADLIQPKAEQSFDTLVGPALRAIPPPNT